MKIKIFADGADVNEMVAGYKNGSGISGFTTNPTLMRKAGITNYEAFAKEVLSKITDLPISLEVFSDELPEMEKQAQKISGWGKNVYVKIPVTNTKGVSTAPIIKNLSHAGIKLNVTAIFTISQVGEILDVLSARTPSIISIFGGRIANAGIDPMPIMREAVAMAKKFPLCEVLWASPREAFNVIQAEQCGCHIITVTSDVLTTMKTFGKSLEQFSLETVQMFFKDAQSAGFTL